MSPTTRPAAVPAYPDCTTQSGPTIDSRSMLRGRNYCAEPVTMGGHRVHRQRAAVAPFISGLAHGGRGLRRMCSKAASSAAGIGSATRDGLGDISGIFSRGYSIERSPLHRRLPRIFRSTSLDSPAGFSGGGAGRGGGGSSFASAALIGPQRGDIGKRSAAMAWRRNAASATPSSSVRSVVGMPGIWQWRDSKASRYR